MAAEGVSLWVENKKEVKRRMVGSNQFYAAFFCRACMERTMQLRDDVAVGLRQNDVQQYLCSQLAVS